MSDSSAQDTTFSEIFLLVGIWIAILANDCMKKQFLLPIVLLLFNMFLLNAQENDSNSSQFVFLPSGLHFSPLKANVEEPRIGVFKFLDAGLMKVDIGNTIDIFGLNYPQDGIRFTAGIDFFAYAYVTGAQGLRLQIDAIDGFFGGNLTFSKTYNENQLFARLRILHHSAHLVDGHYVNATQSWIDNRLPIPFTRDFGELTLTHKVSSSLGVIRYYGGMSYATLVRPTTIERFSFLIGGELYNEQLIGMLLNQPTNIFLAYNLRSIGTPSYGGLNQIQLGLKFGTWNEKGVTLYLGYLTGTHIFAEYFDQRFSTLGAGFTVDFF